MYELREDLIPIFNSHFEQGCDLAEPFFIIKGQPNKTINFFTKRKVNKALKHFEKCLELIPNHWQTKWMLGKLYQVMGEHSMALSLFTEATNVENPNIDVIREASIAAMDAGNVELAVQFSAQALEIEPNDSELICNHAINLMIFKEDEKAIEFIKKAISIDSKDDITQNAYNLILSVSEGKIARPRYDQIL